MGKLVYSMIASLDGYIADEEGKFDWAQPDPETHTFINELTRPIGVHLYGRRMYEVMSAWESDDVIGTEPHIRQFAGIWRAADKVVYSRTLSEPATARTRIEPEFDPGAIRAMKATDPRDASVAGAELAGQALKAGLVDEYHLFVAPYVAGGGKQLLPDGLRLDLELIDQRRLSGGMVYLGYRIR